MKSLSQYITENTVNESMFSNAMKKTSEFFNKWFKKEVKKEERVVKSRTCVALDTGIEDMWDSERSASDFVKGLLGNEVDRIMNPLREYIENGPYKDKVEMYAELKERVKYGDEYPWYRVLFTVEGLDEEEELTFIKNVRDEFFRLCTKVGTKPEKGAWGSLIADGLYDEYQCTMEIEQDTIERQMARKNGLEEPTRRFDDEYWYIFPMVKFATNNDLKSRKTRNYWGV